ncbi:hypothetical protein LEP1GSC166_2117 [Leptospira kirschneri]|nr:hypothetical protein LEP1GSC166_2117 [Leptospira kirschneri]
MVFDSIGVKYSFEKPSLELLKNEFSICFRCIEIDNWNSFANPHYGIFQQLY